MMLLGKQKTKLKPLILADVISILLRAEQSADKTSKLKAFRNQLTPDTGIELKPQIILPDFLVTDNSPQSLLKHLLERREWRNIQSYQNLLRSVDDSIAAATQDYSQRYAIRQIGLEDLRALVDILHHKVHSQRPQVSKITKILQQTSRIRRMIVRRQNINAAMAAVQVWNDVRFFKFLSLKHNQLEAGQIVHVLTELTGAIESCELSPSNNSEGQFNMLYLLKKKKAGVQRFIRQGFEVILLNFTTSEEYAKCYAKYTQLISITKEPHLFEDLQSLVSEHISSICQQISSQSLTVSNSEMYISSDVRYRKLIETEMSRFSMYCRSWHRIVSYHLGLEADHFGQSLLLFRPQVLSMLNNHLSETLRSENRFSTLSMRDKLSIVVGVNDYLSEVNQWMGSQRDELLIVLKQRFLVDQELLSKSVSAELKLNLTEQLRNAELNSLNFSFDHQSLVIVESLYAGIDIERVSNALNPNNSSHSQISPVAIVDGLAKIRTIQPRSRSSFTLLRAVQQCFYRLSFSVTALRSLSELLEFAYHIIALSLPQNQRCVLDHHRYSELLNQLHSVYNGSLFDEQFCQKLQLLRQISLKKLASPIYERNTLQLNRKYRAAPSQEIPLRSTDSQKDLHELEVRITNLVRICQDLHKICDILQQASADMPIGTCFRSVTEFKEGLSEMVSLYCLEWSRSLSRSLSSAVAGIMGFLRWDIKKFNNDTALPFKDYKQKLLDGATRHCEQFRLNLSLFKSKAISSAYEAMFRSVADQYVRIDRISDIGRQLLRLEGIELKKNVGTEGLIASQWLDGFLQLITERNQQIILGKVERDALLYPLSYWRSNLLWHYSDLSSKEKKQYAQRICMVYMARLRDALL